MIKNVVIIGAASAICHEASRNWAKRGYNFKLVGRTEQKLEVVEKDLKAFGAGEIELLVFDLLEYEKHDLLIESIFSQKVDFMLIGHGTLLDQEKTKLVWNMARLEIESNFLSYVSLLTRALPKFKDQGHGAIGVITSVAGDRGRRSNYVYGSAKAGATAFVDGFRAECATFGVSVTTIKPGIVKTPMTAGLDVEGPLAAEAVTVGDAIVKALDKRKRTLYTPFIWQIIMQVIRNIPSFIFDKMKI